MTNEQMMQALIDAFDTLDSEMALAACGKLNNHLTAMVNLKSLIYNLRPKPTMVPVLDEKMPEWFIDFCWNVWCCNNPKGSGNNNKERWSELRTLTSVPEVPEPWRMPTLKTFPLPLTPMLLFTLKTPKANLL